MKLFATTSALALLATPVLAQEAAQSAPPESEMPADVIVTGEKGNASVQEVQTSVRVFSGAEIERSNIIDLFDAIDRTANVTSTFQDSGFTIRGIANTNVTGVGTGDLATVYLDESPVPRGALAGPLDLWDVAQVEILRGPQSTLQGRNALAGAVIIKTADPSFGWQARGRVILTDAGEQRRFAGAVGGPIVADQVAFRISGEHSRSDGFISNPTLGRDDAGFRRGDTIRAKLLITPAAIPDLRVVASYLYDNHSSGATYSIDDAGSWDDRVTLGNRQTIDRTETDLATLDVGYDLGGSLSLSAVTTYSRIKPTTLYDGDDAPEDSAYGDYFQDLRTTTQELRLNLSKGPVQGVIGAYYSWLWNKRDSSHSVFSLSPVDDLGLPSEIGPIYPERIYIDTRQRYPQTVRNLAVFGDGSWQVLRKLKLHAGFRYDSERQVRANDNVVTLVTPLPDPANYGPLGPTIGFINGLIEEQLLAANSSSPAATTTFNAFLPKAGLTYEFTPNVSLSTTVQRGYRSGGSGVNPGRGALYTYQPERTWNYEAALRSLWLGGRLSLNANAFYIDWTNQQVNVQLSGNRYDYETQNAGGSRVYGFEVESRYQPSRALSVYASVGHTNTKFLDFKATGGLVDDLSGNEFANAPHWTLAGGVTWQSAAGWFADLNANWRSAAYQDVIGQSVRTLRPHAIVNAKLGWQNDHFGAYATATNLFDQRYFDYSYVNGPFRESLLGAPQVFGLVLEARY